ncbi:DUF2625 domain-containing protein [Pedobacter sp. MC2016-24]|uniref:DUF2625 domain-containing protein n=1 Tax=Pedobacter sp. MC2016-24 TaxID=2780090 RepID=UPI001D160F40|nr:DUF2625 domain-containing protein [Pedobacter sp. MC2016-24]
MNKYVFLFFIFTISYYSTALCQSNMKSFEELVNTDDPGWPLVSEWIKTAKNKIEVLPADAERAKKTLIATQVTTRSPMGAIIYSSGGILVDGGWIRILGSGSKKLDRSLSDWNKTAGSAGFLLIADDVVGGFFMLNGGGLGKDLGNIYYFSPDGLEYEALDITYSQFLDFCFNNDLNVFYKGLRWDSWQADVKKIDGNQVFNFVPALWTKEGKNINKNSRKAVPVEEQYRLNMELRGK